MSINKVKNSLLFLTHTFHDLKRNANYLLEESFKYTNNNLLIYINPFLRSDSVNRSVSSSVQNSTLIDRRQLRALIAQFYANSYRINPNVNVVCLLHNIHNERLKRSSTAPKTVSPLFNYDLVLLDSLNENDNLEQQVREYLSAHLDNDKQTKIEKIFLKTNDLSPRDVDVECENNEHDLITTNKTYRNTLMGGTFDRLHDGHKILLSEAALLTTEKLLIGLADGDLLVNKKLNELIESVQVRETKLREFLNLVAPYLEIVIVPLYDPFGPSITERDYQCLVISEETQKNGSKVNVKRVENNLPELDVHIVKVIKVDPSILAQNPGDEDKLSSSNERRKLLGTLLKPPYIPYEKDKPYIIGLTGGLASGKSAIRKDLEKMGAATIDCDLLGHKTYEKGTNAYNMLVETFGKEILNENGQIDRKILGGKVFGSKSELKKLTDIVWPEIKKLVNQQVDEFFKAGRKIIVVEAAVLLEANWQSNMNEIWVSFVPNDEALKRAVNRDKSNEEKVKSTLNSQLSNKARLEHTNVAFCSLWEREYTIKQVQKAWDHLQQRTN